MKIQGVRSNITRNGENRSGILIHRRLNQGHRDSSAIAALLGNNDQIVTIISVLLFVRQRIVKTNVAIVS